MDREKLEELHGVSCCGHHTLVALDAYNYIKKLEKENQIREYFDFYRDAHFYI